MNRQFALSPEAGSDRQRAALVNLLADDDLSIYQTVRSKILSCGPTAGEWLRPHTLSSDPVLRRRAREIVHYFARQEADIAFLGFCLKAEESDLEKGAWLLARTAYPDINCEAYQAVLDNYASDLQPRLAGQEDAAEILAVINSYLFDTLGFAGNEAEYYDPQNSYLNRVLDRRTGNPVNLCLIYLLLARRLQLPIAGIGLPRHFICRYQGAEEEIYIDVFNRGRLLTKADCVQHLLQGNYSLREESLSPVTTRRLLARICNNLHQIYLQRELAEETMRMQRYIVALTR